jgi:hypothetical protein
MSVLKKDVTIPLYRQYFLPKEGELANATKDDLEIDLLEGRSYKVIERPDCFIIKNDCMCKSIRVSIKTKD